MSIRAARRLLRLLRTDPGPDAAAQILRADVVGEASRLGLLPVLAGVAVRLGVIPDSSPGVLAVLGDRRLNLSPSVALIAARHENRKRHADLTELERLTRQVLPDVPLVALKGAALSAHAIWPQADERPRRDIDLWCPTPADVVPATERLQDHGFHESHDAVPGAAWVDDHHDLPLLFGDLSGSLELHRYPTIESIRDTIALSTRSTATGIELTPESLLLHVIVHTQLQDYSLVLCRLPIIPLLDVAYALESGFIAESGLRASATSPAARRAVGFHLYCAARLRGGRPPASWAMRVRWHFAVAMLGSAHLATLHRELVLAPMALSRSVMEKREGRRLSVLALAAARLRFLTVRGRTALGHAYRAE